MFAGMGLILTLFLREYSMERKTVYSGDPNNSQESKKNTGTSVGETSDEETRVI